MLVRYAWYSCVSSRCGGEHVFVQDLLPLDVSHPEQLYTTVPVCGNCGRELRMIGRPPQNPSEDP